MTLMTWAEFEAGTRKFRAVEKKGYHSPLDLVDEAFIDYEAVVARYADHKQRYDALKKLHAKLKKYEPSRVEQKRRSADLEKARRYGELTGDDAECIEKLRVQVGEAKAAAKQALNDVWVTDQVCSQLTDIMIADVDFSPAVREAAKKKMVGGISLYDRVKREFDIVTDDTGRFEEKKVLRKVRQSVPKSPEHPEGFVEVEKEVWAKVEGTTRDGAPQERQSEAFINHDKVLSSAKLRAMGQSGIPQTFLWPISQTVWKDKYAVCESITATVVDVCKRTGRFGGTIEWVGLSYSKKSGHSIVIGDREGDIRYPHTWGQNWFVADMWFFNLGMRKQYLWSTDKDREEYLDKEIRPYLATNGGPKIMARLE